MAVGSFSMAAGISERRKLEERKMGMGKELAAGTHEKTAVGASQIAKAAECQNQFILYSVGHGEHQEMTPETIQCSHLTLQIRKLGSKEVDLARSTQIPCGRVETGT